MFKPLVDFLTTQTQHALLNNSLTVKVGDVIIPLSTAGSTHIVTNDTTAVVGNKYPLGVVIGFCDEQGRVIGQGQNPANTPNQLATAVDNTTADKYHAVFYPLTEDMELEGELDNDAGTTTGSDKPYVYFNLKDAGTIDESSVKPHDDSSAPLQVLSLGVIPGETTKIRCRFAKRLYR